MFSLDIRWIAGLPSTANKSDHRLPNDTPENGEECHEVDWESFIVRADDFRIKLRGSVGPGDGADQWNCAGSNRSSFAGRRGDGDANCNGHPAKCRQQ